jgi:hypothetical protein
MNDERVLFDCHLHAQLRAIWLIFCEGISDSSLQPSVVSPPYARDVVMVVRLDLDPSSEV